MSKKSNELLFLPLGGAGEIGMNLSLYGYGESWLMVDCGITFGRDQIAGRLFCRRKTRARPANQSTSAGMGRTLILQKSCWDLPDPDRNRDACVAGARHRHDPNRAGDQQFSRQVRH